MQGDSQHSLFTIIEKASKKKGSLAAYSADEWNIHRRIETTLPSVNLGRGRRQVLFVKQWVHQHYDVVVLSEDTYNGKMLINNRQVYFYWTSSSSAPGLIYCKIHGDKELIDEILSRVKAARKQENDEEVARRRAKIAKNG